MDDKLIQLRLSYLSAQGDYIQAQISFTKLMAMENPNHRLRPALKDSLATAQAYHLSLERLLEYLLSAEPSQKITWETQHVRMKIDILDKEINAISRFLTTLNEGEVNYHSYG